MPVIICSLVLLGLIWRTARHLYGETAGLLALGLAATSPDLLAHGHLATLDVPLTLGASVCLAGLLWFAARPSRRRHLVLVVGVGAMLATKVSAVQVGIALGAAALALALIDPELAGRGSVAVPRRCQRHPRLASLYVLGGGLTVAVGYGLILLALSYGLSGWTAPVRHPFWHGVVQNAMLAGYGHPTYLLGEVSWEGFPGYYLVALGVKLPLLTLALLTVAALTWPWLRLGRGRIEAALVAFAGCFLLQASLAPAQTGVRYVLPIYPVLFVLVARLARVPMRPPIRMVAGAAVIGALLGVVAAARPDYLGYFNERVDGPREGINILADSNLDWGQDLGRLARWLRANGDPPVRLAYFGNAPPEAYGIRYQALPAAGPVLRPPPDLLPAGSPDLVCVSANNLLGLFLHHDAYDWLREREPLAVIGSSIWVYDLGGRRADHLALARVYRRFNWKRWAAHEAAVAEGGG